MNRSVTFPVDLREPPPEKQAVVERLAEKFRASGSFFLTDFSGLTVEQATLLRKNLREQRIAYVVAKNTLIRLAAQKTGLSGLDEHLSGPTGIVFGAADPVVAAKILFEFMKKAEKPRLKAFWVDGQLYPKPEFNRLAQLPSRPGLLARLVGALNAPLANFVGTCDGILRTFIGTLEALAAQKEKT